jgi:hypothetical protein
MNAQIQAWPNLHTHIANIMSKSSRRLFYINVNDWTWWA